VWNKTETDENTSCPMIDWTSQNWTKRDWRNYQAIAADDFTTLCPFSSCFDLSILALDRIVWNKTETDKNTAVQWEIGQVKTGQKGTGEKGREKRDETGQYRQMTEQEEQEQQEELSDI
jgi:hypothetical protein